MEWEVLYEDGTTARENRDKYGTLDRFNVEAIRIWSESGLMLGEMEVEEGHQFFCRHRVGISLLGKSGKQGVIFGTSYRNEDDEIKHKLMVVWEDGKEPIELNAFQDPHAWAYPVNLMPQETPPSKEKAETLWPED